MYYDAVLDDNGNVLFNGTSEETAEWLRKQESTAEMTVFPGATLRPTAPTEYLKRS